jgi:hypothetical protein
LQRHSLLSVFVPRSAFSVYAAQKGRASVYEALSQNPLGARVPIAARIGAIIGDDQYPGPDDPL